MADSDDYFSDDLVLDAQVLAVLDEEESKFKHTQSPGAGDAPPAKRQKTASGWQSRRNVKRDETLDDMDDLPEISIRNDGTYGVGSSAGQPVSSTKVVVESNSQTHIALGANHTGYTSQSRHFVPSQPERTSFSSAANHGPMPTRRVPQRHASNPRPARPSPSPIAISIPPPSNHANESPLSKMIETMQREMEELRNTNLKLQADCQQFLDAKLTKDGEVTNIRKKYEKVVQEHAAALARQKASKEESDAKALQKQREMKEEIERMKTEFTFKQHEAETANRKVPWSVRSNRIGRGPEPTPVPISSQMRAWNQNISNAGPSRAEPQSPRRPRFGDISRNERARKPPPPENKNMPSGFQTTTNPSSPTRSQNVKGKGKASAFSIPARPPTIFESGSQIFGGGSLFNAPVRSSQEAVDNPALDDTIMGASQIIDQNHVAPADIEMADVANIAYLATPFEEEIEEFEPRNWNIVLRRSILTHIAPDQKSFTFQVLVGAPITTSISSQSAELYQSSCGQLLNILSQTSHDDRDFRYSLGVASQSLAQIARILAIADLISELSAVFNLLTHLIYTVPNFHPYLLPVCDLSQGKDAPSLILQILCEVIRHKFVAIKADHENDMSGLPSLVRALLGLIEAMCWNLPNDLEDWLAFIPRSPLVLTTLLDTARPQWMLLRSVRVLLWLSTRHSLFRSLLSFPAAETSNQEQEKETEIPDITRLPHIETLCSLLADTERKGAEAESMRNFILSFFAMLCVSHTDAHTILVESRAVIPSLLVYMTRLSTTLWEDDEVLMASPSLASSWISSLNQSLCLFHYVIFGAESMPNLRERLELAQSYNGLMHMFIVTIGRMSYAEPPEWVDAKDKADLEEVSDMARELLELVVEGPEGDSIWSTYQEQNDRNSDIAIDDDEEEARKLVNDGV